MLTFAERLKKDKILDQADFDAMETEIKKIVTEAVEFADASPDPDLESLYQDVTV